MTPPFCFGRIRRSIGAVANVGIAGYLFSEQYAWWLSGIAGILVGAVWNYAASSVYTWKK